MLGTNTIKRLQRRSLNEPSGNDYIVSLILDAIPKESKKATKRGLFVRRSDFFKAASQQLHLSKEKTKKLISSCNNITSANRGLYISENSNSEHPTKQRTSNSTFTVYEHIKNGGSPSELWKKNTLKENVVKYHTGLLKKLDLVRNVGYGTWEIVGVEQSEAEITRLKKEHRVTMAHTHPKCLKSDTVRLHDCRVVLKIKKSLMKWWIKRVVFLKRAKVPFEPIQHGQRISIADVKTIMLYDKTIVIYLPNSWYADTAPKALVSATSRIIYIIKKLENKLKCQPGIFKIGKGYRFRISSSHCALVKNALAKDYLRRKEKLEVYDEEGLWLTIDNSLNLEELETIGKDAIRNSVVIQELFNSVKDRPITSHKIYEMHESNEKAIEANSRAILALLDLFYAQIQIPENVETPYIG